MLAQVVRLGLLGVAAAAGTAAGQEVVYSFQGTAPDDWFGKCVAGPGDLNGDGVADVLVDTATYPSTVTAFSGADGSILYAWTSPFSSYDDTTMCGAGDVDADGFADVVIRELQHVKVYSGKNGLLLHALPAQGATVAAGGDLDQDGFDDVLVGGVGTVTAFSGYDGSVLRVLPGLGLPYDNFGVSVASAGDFNGDGWLDVVGGAPDAGAPPFDYGYAAVLSGKDAAVLFVWFGMYRHFGLAVAGVGDVDGDGRDDVAVNEVPSSQTFTYVFAGLSAAPLFTFFDPARPRLGDSIAGGGDVDGDGVPDVLLGGYGNGDWPGAVRVHSGKTGMPILERFGTAALERLGASVAFAGDLDGNGLFEVIAGAPAASAVPPVPGHALVLSNCAAFLVAAYGAGCPGAGGFIPAIDLDGCPMAAGSVHFRLTGGAGGAPALLLIGVAPASLPAGGGCTLLLQPVLAALPLVLAGSQPGEGEAQLDATLPPALAPGKITMQAFVLDAASPIGAAASNGLEVTVP
ncbi:MAG: VCBS repeat-containing protein [Planctomycetes bacterium]|nr:VCBS repeat-containing protein [Planctomycetota bacterium]